MAVKKIIKPVVPEKNPAPVPEPVQEVVPKYISKGVRLFHPWQRKYIDTSKPVELEMDSWLKSQLEAGLIRQC
jgi:hypothetical protein